jgi:hypothetical protein
MLPRINLGASATHATDRAPGCDLRAFFSARARADGRAARRAGPLRHRGPSPAVADVSTVDALHADRSASGPVPAELEHGPASGRPAKLLGAMLQVGIRRSRDGTATAIGSAPSCRSSFPRREPYRGGPRKAGANQL